MSEVEREVHESGAIVLRLARPPVNALWTGLLRDLETALEREAGEGGAAIVLTGAGSCFSAGIDTKLSAGATREQRKAGIAAINRTVRMLFGMPIPVVAALNGHALGGGLVLPLACDVVIATHADCKLGLNEAAAGVPFPAVPLAAVRARLSPPVLNNLCLTGRTFGPEEALALGVVDELVEGPRLVARAAAVAAGLAGLPAFGAIKGQLRAPQLAEMESLAERDPMLRSPG